jgi:hypothetical protein
MSSIPLTTHAGRIEIKLRRVAQLFDTWDPSPFRESDLAQQAEDYIVGDAEDLPKDAPIEIVIHLPPDERSQASTFDVASAIRNYFGLRSQAVSREIRELFKTGRLALAIGVIVLASCVLLGWHFAQRVAEGPLAHIFSESFLIFGWVAIWKPSEIFLYAWPPLVRRRKLLRRLSEANVVLEFDAPAT